MPENARRGKKIIFDLFQVGVTDATTLDADQDFAGAEQGSGDRLHFNPAVSEIHCGPHKRGNGITVAEFRAQPRLVR